MFILSKRAARRIMIEEAKRLLKLSDLQLRQEFTCSNFSIATLAYDKDHLFMDTYNNMLLIRRSLRSRFLKLKLPRVKLDDGDLIFFLHSIIKYEIENMEFQDRLIQLRREWLNFVIKELS